MSSIGGFVRAGTLMSITVRGVVREGFVANLASVYSALLL